MKYYIKSAGKVYGPAEEHKIAAKIACGFFSENCLISTDREEWIPWPVNAPEVPEEPELRPVPEEPEAPPPRIEPPRIERPRPEQIGLARPVQPGVIRLTAEDIVADGAAPKGGGVRRAVLIVVIIILLALLAAGGWLLYDKLATPGVSAPRPGRGGSASRRSAPRVSAPGKSAPGPATKSFQEVCDNYQNAVGVVVVTLGDSEGNLLTKIGNITIDCDQPIGTAFAIDGDKFVTNCHVAYGIKDTKSGVLENILLRVYIAEAKKRGVKSDAEFAEFCNKNRKSIIADREFLQKNMQVRRVEIRLSNSNGMALPVTGVQIHPRYKTHCTTKEDANRNHEFDVAILTTAKKTPTYFRIAGIDELYKLSQGQPIAYLGFPMEGLADHGGLNIEKPEATFKSGSVNKITDFNNIHGDPKNNRSLVHDIPTVGGASGSPIFLENGEVVAVAWGASHNLDENGKRTASAAQHNFAVRIDALEAVEEEKVHDISEWLGENK